MARMDEKYRDIAERLREIYKTQDVGYGKGGFFIRGVPWISLAKARKITGIAAAPRETRGRAGPWGDYATIYMLSKPRKRLNPMAKKRLPPRNKKGQFRKRRRARRR